MELLAVVKANAYGHGTADVVRALDGRAALFGVANLHEAEGVEAVKSTTPIVLLGSCLPDEREAALRDGLHVSISSVDEAAAWDALAAKLGRIVYAHITPFSLPSGPATGSFNGLHRESNFLAINHPQNSLQTPPTPAWVAASREIHSTPSLCRRHPPHPPHPPHSFPFVVTKSSSPALKTHAFKLNHEWGRSPRGAEVTAFTDAHLSLISPQIETR